MPAFEMPVFEPPSADNSGGFGAPNMSSGLSTIDQKNLKVAKQARSNRKVTSTIIATRQSFAAYLAGFGMTLLTSALDFQKTRDFILSSVVVHTNSVKEPLVSFIVRYPQFQPACLQIKNQLATLAGLQVTGLTGSIDDFM